MTLRKLLTGNPGNLDEVAKMALERGLPVQIYHLAERGGLIPTFFSSQENSRINIQIQLEYLVGTDEELENGEVKKLSKSFNCWSQSQFSLFCRKMNSDIQYLNENGVTCYEHSGWGNALSGGPNDIVHFAKKFSGKGALSLAENNSEGRLSLTQGEGYLSLVQGGEISIKK